MYLLVGIIISIIFFPCIDCYSISPRDAVDIRAIILGSIYKKQSLLKPQVQTFVPKKIHQIWLGGALPEQFQLLCDSWKKKHPSWEYKLWTDEDVESFGMKNKGLMDASINQGYRSDLLRYEILERHGGVYVDVDFECLRSLDDLNHTYECYMAVLCHGSLANGMIGIVPHHPIMIACINHVRLPLDDGEDILYASGPHLITNIFIRYFNAHPQSRVISLPIHSFFPFSSLSRFLWQEGKLSREDILKDIPADSYAVHYWANSWQRNLNNQ